MNAKATVHLGEVASFVRGITFKPDDVAPVGSEGTVACMRTKNVQSELDLSDVWGIPASFVRRNDQYLVDGDLLVSSANSWNLVGKCCWVPGLPWKATFGGFISVLRSDRVRIEPRYLYHWFSSPRIQATVRSLGQQTTNISNLNVDRCLRLPLPLPPLPEQRRIAEILDKADALRAKRRAALAQLETLTQSIFLDMFGDPVTNPKGWPVRLLAELGVEFRYGTSNKAAATGRPALRIPNVVGGSIDTDDLKRVPVSDDEFERLRLRDGDLLFVRTNGNPDFVGRCAVFEAGRLRAAGFSGDGFVFASYLIRGRVTGDKVSPAFLREYMLGAEGRRQMRARCKTSAGQYNINVEGLCAIEVVAPPIELQMRFARRLDLSEALKRSHRLALRTTDRLFASLQHRAFRCEL